MKKIKNISISKAFKRTAVVLLCVISLLLIIRISPKKPILSDYSFSQAVFDKDDKLLRLTISQDEKYRLFIPLSKMPQSLKKGTLLYEDKYFYFHPGINPVSLMKGFWTSIIKKQRPVGASTITMQLARMLYDINSTSITGKLKQIFAALRLEVCYGKNDILEAYLNIAPYGYNIEGAAAASLIYFSAKVENLTILEAFTLCVIPQNPNFRKLSNTGSRENPENARKRVFEMWVKKYPQDSDKRNYFDMPLHIKKPSNLPFEAPHLVNKMLALSNESQEVCHTRMLLKNVIPQKPAPECLNRVGICSFLPSVKPYYRFPTTALGNDKQRSPNESVISTTLDLNLQHLLEQRIRFYADRNINKGINNASAMLVNYKTMEVSAYAGSADFFNDLIEGQVNGCAAYRSPGSTLKPFIYAIALDKGIIHPLTLMKDTPKHYGIYAPENSDRDFLGPVFAKDALTQSRNIPAIDLLIRINPDNFLYMLQKAGVRNLKNSEYYGSSFAIGGFEISMEKIAELYAMLANGGVLKSLKFNKFEKVKEESIITPEAAFLTLIMLKDNKRPENEIRAAENFHDFEVYWKTGTSYAYRDAWTAGVFGDYVLVVWIGKFDNEGRQTFTARTSAAPLFFEIVKSISGEKREIRGSKISADGLNISKVEVCSVSGDLPSQYCNMTAETYFIPAKSPIRVCDVHRPVYIDKKTGLRTPFHDPEKTNIAVYEFWNSEIMSIFAMAGISHRTPPKYMPDLEISKVTEYGNPPQIILPTQNITYTFRAENFDNETVPFKADTDSDAKNVFWFLNNKYIGQSKSGTVLTAKTEPGEYTVRAVDDMGRASTAKLKVEIIGK